MKRDKRHPGLRSVEPIPDPYPAASFGSIGRFVKVECDPGAEFALPRLTISYSPEDLGWVDPSSLRIFEVDPERGEFHLVFRSTPDPERREVHALIERSGIYGIIGLPRDEALLRAIRALSVLIPSLGDVDGIEVGDLLGMVCGRILCVPPSEGGVRDDLVPPGGVGGDVCQFCLGRSAPPNGLPEFQLLPILPHRRAWRRLPPTPPPPPGPFLYALLSHYIWAPPGDTIVEIVDLSSMTCVQTVHVGAFMSFAMALTPHGICVLDQGGGSVVIVDPTGGTRSVPVGPLPWDCVPSPDGSTLYVSVVGSIVVLDVTAGQITRTVAASPGGPRVLHGPLALARRPHTSRWDEILAARVCLRHADAYAEACGGNRPSTPRGNDRVPSNHRRGSSPGLGLHEGSHVRGRCSDGHPVAGGHGRRGAHHPVRIVAEHLLQRSETRGLRYPDPKGPERPRGGSCPHSDGISKGGIADVASRTCLHPRDGKTLFISVCNPLLAPITLDAYDTQAESFARGVYTFRNQVSSRGDVYFLWDMVIAD